MLSHKRKEMHDDVFPRHKGICAAIVLIYILKNWIKTAEYNI